MVVPKLGRQRDGERATAELKSNAPYWPLGAVPLDDVSTASSNVLLTKCFRQRRAVSAGRPKFRSASLAHPRAPRLFDSFLVDGGQPASQNALIGPSRTWSFGSLLAPRYGDTTITEQ